MEARETFLPWIRKEQILCSLGSKTFKVSKVSFQGLLLQCPSNGSEWHCANAYLRKSYFSGGQWDTEFHVRQLLQLNPRL